MARAHPWTFASAALRRSWRRLYRSPQVARSLLFHPNTREEVVHHFVAAVQEESWIAGNQMNTLPPEPQKIVCPVTVIAGERDFMVDRRAHERTARDYSTSLLIFADCAHMVPCEANAAKLARAIVGQAA
jgi:pimeloyl-ACP methyl ester carboxylesterase